MLSNKFGRTAHFFLWHWLLILILFTFQPLPLFGVARTLEVNQALPDFDSRAGQTVPPSGAALAIVSGLGAKASWNNFGTPQSLIKYGGYLATGLSGDPVTAAKNWIRSNKALFRLSDAGVDSLELLNDSKMSDYDGHAVIFRQKFGNLPATQDGMITIGIANGKIVYVSSSAVGDQNVTGTTLLTPVTAWLNSAVNIGRSVTIADISSTRIENSWTVFDVVGFSYPQRSRLVAFATTSGARPAFETIVLDVQSGAATGYKIFVDAENGSVLFRQNAVHQLAQSTTFTGEYQDGPTAADRVCGPLHPFNAPAGTKTIDVVGHAAVITNDIVLKLFDPASVQVGQADTATSPEAIHYEPAVLVPGTYNVQICPYDSPLVPPTPPFAYAGSVTVNDVVGTSTFPYPPKWNVFAANPELDLSTNDTRDLWCWESVVGGTPVPGCDLAIKNLAARAPWDHDVRLNSPTYTTKGNAAFTGEAWGSPLTPAEQYRPVATDREYDFMWGNLWQENLCSQLNFTPQGNDIDAATANLFAMHNRMHDWSYFLGFTEQNYNMQENNFGNTAPGAYPLGRENDPEVGNSQAGGVSGGAPSYTGRDNANQITLNDGIPGITNMYLWQPIAGAFYAPCVDGDYDMSVIGHEYTHAIENRMIGGPDASRTGPHAGAMGESYADLTAVEYLNEFGFVPTAGEHPFAVGPYVTGNLEKGIRNYNMTRNLAPPNATPLPPVSQRLNTTNPLNFSNVGYDFVCNTDLLGACTGNTQFHADGEIWSATNYDIRQALVAKYNSGFPASNATLQKDCANGVLPARLCPGNRRWMQIVFDAYLLMQPSVNMLEARDAYLAADQMRADVPNGGWPSNQREIWKAFARRGFGIDAAVGPAPFSLEDPKPSFESSNSPVNFENEKTVKFRVFATDNANAPINTAKIFVGHYEARSTPIADTDTGTSHISDTAKFVNGNYDFFVSAPGYGHVRFPRFFTAGGSLTLDIFMSTNRASINNGAVATGTGTNINNLIDDTELTNWVGATPVNLQQVTVDLEGVVQNVKRVNVSAMLTLGSAGRFTALRDFKILTCNTTNPATPTCTLPTDFAQIYSAANAFPTGIPRPIAPDLILRGFDVPDTNATHVRLQVVNNQCTATGTPFRDVPPTGDQDNDPLNETDCVDGSTADNNVRAAELQVFTSTPALPPRDPAVVVTMSAPATAPQGSTIGYQITYTNLGPAESSNAKITNVLPVGLEFVSAANGGSYNAATRTVTWNLGTVNVGYTGTVNLNARITGGVGSTIVNQAEYTADLTAATPAVAITAVLP